MPTSLLSIYHYIERSKYSLGLTPIAWLMIRQYVLYPDLLATTIPCLQGCRDHTSTGLDVLNIPALFPGWFICRANVMLLSACKYEIRSSGFFNIDTFHRNQPRKIVNSLVQMYNKKIILYFYFIVYQILYFSIKRVYSILVDKIFCLITMMK